MANKKRYSDSTTFVKNVRRGEKDPSMYKVSAFSTTVYSSIPKSDDDIYVITQEGDRLDLLAHQFYGDVSLWWYIAKANNLKFITLDVGKRLRIPATTKYAVGR